MKPDLRREIELACKNLPEGWILHLYMEKGAAWLELEDPESSVLWDEDEMGINSSDDLACRINQAVDFPTYRAKLK